jgi:hypothetical protein
VLPRLKALPTDVSTHTRRLMKAPKSFNIHDSYAAHSSVAIHIIIPQYTRQLCCTQFSSYPHHHPTIYTTVMLHTFQKLPTSSPHFPAVRQLTLTFYCGFHKQFTGFYHSVNLMKIIFVYFKTRSRSREKRLLSTSCLSVRPYLSTRIPLDRFS